MWLWVKPQPRARGSSRPRAGGIYNPDVPVSPSVPVQSPRPTAPGGFCCSSVARVSHDLRAGSGQSQVRAGVSLRAQRRGLRSSTSCTPWHHAGEEPQDRGAAGISTCKCDELRINESPRNKQTSEKRSRCWLKQWPQLGKHSQQPQSCRSRPDLPASQASFNKKRIKEVIYLLY